MDKINSLNTIYKKEVIVLKKILKKIIPWKSRDLKIDILCHKATTSYKKNKKQLSYYYCYKLYKLYNIDISGSSIIGENLYIPHPFSIVIGGGVKIGNNVTIYQNVTIGRKNKDIPEYPKIGNNVTIYCNSTILGNITIGDGAIIGAGSVILRDVAPGEKVHGVVN